MSVPGSRRPVWLIPLCVVAILIPFVVAAVTGNLAIPHNDSWVYSRIARTFWETGHIRLLDWDDMTLVGQLLMTGPMGTSFVWQQTEVAVLAAICLWCVYDVVSETLTVRSALLATLMIIIWPGFANLATSFMTDVPALTGTLATVAVGNRALRRDSRVLLGVALLIAFWAATVGIQTLAAPAALLLVGLVTSRSRARLRIPVLLGAGFAFAIPFYLFYRWRADMPNGDFTTFSIDTSLVWQVLKGQCLTIYFTLGAILSPAAILRVRPWNWRWLSWLLVALVVVAAVQLLATHQSFAVGNYFQPTGEYYQVMIQPHDAIPGWLWDLEAPLAIAGGIAIAGTVGERWRSINPVLGVFTVFAAIGTFTVPMMRHLFFDRYLLPMAPGVLAVLLATPRPARRVADAERLFSQVRRALERPAVAVLRAAAAFAFVTVAAMSAMLAVNAFSFDATRWHSATRVVRAGVPADRIDAGLEWLGTHSANGMAYTRFSGTGGPYDWETQFYNRRACVVLLNGTLPPSQAVQDHWKLIHTFSYRTYLIFGKSYLYAYSTPAADCPAVHLS